LCLDKLSSIASSILNSISSSVEFSKVYGEITSDALYNLSFDFIKRNTSGFNLYFFKISSQDKLFQCFE